MSALDEKTLPKNVGLLYVADYSTGITQLLSDLSNAGTVKGQLEALSYEEIASITDLEVIENLAKNMVKVETDDRGTIYKATTPEVSIKGNWYEIFTTDVVEKILGQTAVAQAGSAVTGATQTWDLNTVTKDKFYPIANQNASGLVPTITYVKQGATTLTLNTEYRVIQDETGVWGLVFLTAFDATKTTILTYNYTPASAKYQGSVLTTKQLPQLVVKIVSLDTETNKTRITYLVNCGLESDYVSSFIDVVRAKDMKPTPFEFVGNKLGFILKYFEV